MALTCSLLGHDFDDYEVVREREERGSEVVTSVREVAVCERCGTERVLSENTEVTSVVDPTDVDVDVDADAVTANGREGEDAVATDDATASPTAEGTTDVADETAGEGVPAPDETALDATPGPDADPGTGTEDPGSEAAGSPTDEGAELVEGEATGDVGGLDATDVDPADAAPDPTEGSGDADEAAGADAPDPEGTDDDAVILTDAPEEREYGEWPSHDDQRYRPWDPDRLLDDPDATEDDGPTVAEVMGEEPTDGSGAGDAASDDAPQADAADDAGADGPEFEETEAVRDATTFRCPECGFETAAGAVSLRRGDACPSCHRGYLVAERNP